MEYRTVAAGLAHKYWLTKCRGEAIPSREDISPAEMVAFLPNILLLDVQDEPLDFRFRLVGTRIVPLLSRDYTGEWMSAIDILKAPGTVWENCSRAVESAEPVYAFTPYVGPKKDVLDVEDLILPLASDGKNVDMLMVILASVQKTMGLHKNGDENKTDGLNTQAS
ncbi:PAS domain-containing protein [Kiloniella spongiae]|uniref:PAS domain-containing protein n=1 Tax=Kiloniella spongiae TaxID=1489064 RepID=UPI00138DEAE2|nr:PAS domain-containing protein [Kiloniella spongiae]